MAGIIYHTNTQFQMKNPENFFQCVRLLLLLLFRKISFGIVRESKSARGFIFVPKQSNSTTNMIMWIENRNARVHFDYIYCIHIWYTEPNWIGFYSIVFVLCCWKSFSSVFALSAWQGWTSGCFLFWFDRKGYPIIKCACAQCVLIGSSYFLSFSLSLDTFDFIHSRPHWWLFFSCHVISIWSYETCAKCDTFNLFYGVYNGKQLNDLIWKKSIKNREYKIITSKHLQLNHGKNQKPFD